MSQPRPWYQLSVSRLLALVFVCALASLLIKMVHDARESARRSECVGHLKQIALALYNYHDANGCFPPAYVADAQGKPMHSWRVLILPWMERGDLYNRYHFNEPWDSPNNAKLAQANPFAAGLPPTMPRSYVCPSHHEPDVSVFTDYVVVSGPGTAFPGAAPAKFGDITDGRRNTLLVVEAADTNIHWMEPRDLEASSMGRLINDPQRPGISSRHPGGANVCFCDTMIHFLKDSLDPRTLRAYVTAHGGEPVEPE